MLLNKTKITLQSRLHMCKCSRHSETICKSIMFFSLKKAIKNWLIIKELAKPPDIFAKSTWFFQLVSVVSCFVTCTCCLLLCNNLSHTQQMVGGHYKYIPYSSLRGTLHPNTRGSVPYILKPKPVTELDTKEFQSLCIEIFKFIPDSAALFHRFTQCHLQSSVT